MKTIEHMTATEPVIMCEVKAGTFFYLDATGEQCKAEFYVHTCTGCDDPDTMDERVNDYNGQYCAMYCQLLNEGCTNIRYEEDTHSLILG